MADDDDASDVDGGTGKTAAEAGLADYQKVTLPRRRLGRWCNEPFFKKAILNCYVKLFIGVNEQGKRCYRLCKIVGVSAGEEGTYQLPAVKKERPVSDTFVYYSCYYYYFLFWVENIVFGSTLLPI